MKRIGKRKVIFDALTVCYEVENSTLFDKIAALEFGEVMEFYDLNLTRVNWRYFKNNYTIRYNELGVEKIFGQLKFALIIVAKSPTHSRMAIPRRGSLWAIVPYMKAICFI